MEAVVGVFDSYLEAAGAWDRLQMIIDKDHINMLSPLSSAHDLQLVPTTEDMPRVGKVIGGAVGGAAGAALGATFLIPGLGAVTAVGALATALFGVGGAVAGAAAGEFADRYWWEGMPADDLYVYEDALRKGRTVIIATTDTAEQAEQVREILDEAGAESLDAARENWWVGIRSSEELEYPSGKFGPDESAFRKGFESALTGRLRSKSFEEALPDLRRRYPNLCDKPAFRRGYERGHKRAKSWVEG